MKRLLRFAVPLAIILTAAFAQSLSLTIGNPVAGQDYVLKTSQFIFRLNGCTDLSKAQVTATAEGVVGEARRSTSLRLLPAQTSGVYAINRQWGTEGKWVVAITASCLRETVGAIVPVDGRGFVRESTELLQHAPSPDEVDSALKNFTPAVPLRGGVGR